MFEARPLSDRVEAVRDERAPEALVFDCDRDFETLPPAQAEELGLVVDSLEPATYPRSWLPADAPPLLVRYVGSDFTIGMPGDGSVVWTRQTDPPVLLVKPRVRGSPESFVEFLLAEALVEVGLNLPEHFLGFFEDRYPALSDATPLGPNATYQIAAALFDGWKGLHTRAVFAGWRASADADEAVDTGGATNANETANGNGATNASNAANASSAANSDTPNGAHPELAAAWQDAGTRLEDRVAGLPRAVARGDTDFADATELACAAIKHAIELPAPFDALDADAYRDHGPGYAVRWVEKTFGALEE